MFTTPSALQYQFPLYMQVEEQLVLKSMAI